MPADQHPPEAGTEAGKPKPEEFNVSRASDPIEVAKRLLNNAQNHIPTTVRFVDVAGDQEVGRGVTETARQAKIGGKIVGVTQFGAYLLISLPFIMFVVSAVNTALKVIALPWPGIGRLHDYLAVVGSTINRHLWAPVLSSALFFLAIFVGYLLVFAFFGWVWGRVSAALVSGAQKKFAEEQKARAQQKGKP
jgi:hypothetical protein